MDKWELLQKGVYMICKALVTITDDEDFTYGFDDEVKMAKEYIKGYEEDHPDGKKA